MKYITYDQLPLMLNAEDIQAVMNISRAGAYQLMHREDFPIILIGKRMVVPGTSSWSGWKRMSVSRMRASKWIRRLLAIWSIKSDIASLTSCVLQD